MVAICATIDVWDSIKRRLELEKHMELQERGKLDDDQWSSLNTVLSQIDVLQGLASRIRNAVVSDDAQEDSSVDALGAFDEDIALSTKASDRLSPLTQRWSIQPQ